MTQQINLFNPAFQKQKKVFTARTMARALLLLLGGTVLMSVYFRHMVDGVAEQVAAGAVQLNHKKTQLNRARIEFAPRVKSAELETQIGAAEAEVSALQDVTRVLQRGDLGNTAGFSPYFKALARQSDGALWLTGVAVGAAGHQIDLQGRAMNPELIPAYIGRLAHEPVMQGKTFGSLEIVRGTLQAAPGSGGATVNPAGTSKAAELAPYVDFNLQATMHASQAGTPAIAAPDGATAQRILNEASR